jgi:hypothetical protein
MRETYEKRMKIRSRLHGTGWIWNRAEIRPCKHTRSTEPDEFEFRPKQAKKDEFQTDPKFVRYRVNGVLMK